jgi:hypothetical protein
MAHSVSSWTILIPLDYTDRQLAEQQEKYVRWAYTYAIHVEVQ